MAYPSATTYPSGTTYPSTTADVAASIVGQYSATTTSVTVTDTPQPGDVLVLMAAIQSGDYTLSSVSGCGATWAQNYYLSTQNGTGAMSRAAMIWVGSNPNASGTINVTTTGGTIGLKAYLVRGTNGVVSSVGVESDLEIGVPSVNVGAGQVVLNMGALFDNSPKYPTSLTPSTGWTTAKQALLAGWTDVYHGWRVPQGDPEPHRLTASSAVGAPSLMVQAVVGAAPPAPQVSTATVDTPLNLGLEFTATKVAQVKTATVETGLNLGLEFTAVNPSTLKTATVEAPLDLGLGFTIGRQTQSVTVETGLDLGLEFIAERVPKGKVYVWDGTAWSDKPLQTWDGSQWVSAPLRVFDGRTWRG